MTILVIDDNKDILLLVKTILELSKFKVTIADNGIEAVSLCKQNNFSLIFVDLMMDGMDGYTVLKEIKKINLYTNTPIIALTAKTYQKDKENVISHGFNEHVSKPFRTTDIIQIAEKYLATNSELI
jgi:CheY-like chemotaxis protein